MNKGNMRSLEAHFYVQGHCWLLGDRSHESVRDQDVLPKLAPQGCTMWRGGPTDSPHHQVISNSCFLSCPHVAGGTQHLSPAWRLAPGSPCVGAVKQSRTKGPHVVSGLCQPGRTVLPLRDTKSPCLCCFFPSSKPVRVQSSLQRLQRLLADRAEGCSHHTCRVPAKTTPQDTAHKVRVAKHPFHLDCNLKEK